MEPPTSQLVGGFLNCAASGERRVDVVAPRGRRRLSSSRSSKRRAPRGRGRTAWTWAAFIIAQLEAASATWTSSHRVDVVFSLRVHGIDQVHGFVPDHERGNDHVHGNGNRAR
jgi:hypothetical protein